MKRICWINGIDKPQREQLFLQRFGFLLNRGQLITCLLHQMGRGFFDVRFVGQPPVERRDALVDLVKPLGQPCAFGVRVDQPVQVQPGLIDHRHRRIGWLIDVGPDLTNRHVGQRFD